MTSAGLRARLGSAPFPGMKRSRGPLPLLPLALAFMLVPAASSAEEVVLRVLATGDARLAPDASRGSSGPYSTIADAISAARDVRRAKPGAGIVIALDSGMHRLDRPVRIGPGDGGAPGRPLVVRGDASGATIVRGSIELTARPGPIGGYASLRPPASTSARLYELPARLASLRHIDAALPRGTSILDERFRPAVTPSLGFEVHDENGAMVPARWPNSGWATVEAPGPDAWWGFVTRAPRVALWTGEPDLWAAGYWRYDYTYERHHVRAVDAGTLSISTPFTMGMIAGTRYHVYHALAELDAPGEWYRDTAKNLLIAWPRAAASRVPRLEVADIESAFAMDGASHVRLERLTIERFYGDGVRVVGGRDVVIRDSTLRWTGMRGAAFHGARESGIEASDISDTGEGGVMLSAGDRHTLTPAGLFVRSCRIERFARIALTWKPAIDLAGVGNIASGNYIAEGPHMAIQFQGNDHLIELNEFADVVTDTSDSSVLYSGHDWSAQGTIVRHNFFRDIRGGRPGFDTKGVYLDDFTSGDTVEGNLFLRVKQPVFIGGGRDNVIAGNVFIASEPAIHIDSRGLEWQQKFIVDPASALRTRLAAVPYRSERWRQRYPGLADLLEDEPGEAKRNITRRNVIIASKPFFFETQGKPGKQSLGPDVGDGKNPLPLNPAEVQALAEARTAAEVGAILTPALARLPGPLPPFAEMDRGQRAGRRKPSDEQIRGGEANTR